ncbi:hypothetical protein TWF694_003638 [Orbilia ellipsospora]|uniref:Ricin B lectin domain-containing protein n=1 Tax=Orbilia ellipsospora TaxID=2528407 RepID=A0AAV9WZM5_9PEZI
MFIKRALTFEPGKYRLVSALPPAPIPQALAAPNLAPGAPVVNEPAQLPNAVFRINALLDLDVCTIHPQPTSQPPQTALTVHEPRPGAQVVLAPSDPLSLSQQWIFLQDSPNSYYIQFAEVELALTAGSIGSSITVYPLQPGNPAQRWRLEKIAE